MQRPCARTTVQGEKVRIATGITRTLQNCPLLSGTCTPVAILAFSRWRRAGGLALRCAALRVRGCGLHILGTYAEHAYAWWDRGEINCNDTLTIDIHHRTAHIAVFVFPCKTKLEGPERNTTCCSALLCSFPPTSNNSTGFLE